MYLYNTRNVTYIEISDGKISARCHYIICTFFITKKLAMKAHSGVLFIFSDDINRKYLFHFSLPSAIIIIIIIMISLQ